MLDHLAGLQEANAPRRERFAAQPSHETLFCDIFEMRDSKIRRLTSYLVETK